MTERSSAWRGSAIVSVVAALALARVCIYRQKVHRARLRYASLLAAVTVALGLASPVDAVARVFLPNCGNTYYGGRVAPVTWDAGCTGTPELLRTSWFSWGRRAAIGKGRTTYNDCEPSCADGTVYTYRARARASRIRRCKGRSGKHRRFYTRVRISFWVPNGDSSGLREGKHTARPFELVCGRT